MQKQTEPEMEVERANLLSRMERTMKICQLQGGLGGSSMEFVRAYQGHPGLYSSEAQHAYEEKLLECGDWKIALEATRNFPIGNVA